MTMRYASPLTPHAGRAVFGLLAFALAFVSFALTPQRALAQDADEVKPLSGAYRVVDVVLHNDQGLVVPPPADFATAFAGFKALMINATGGGHHYKFSKKGTVEITMGKEKAEAEYVQNPDGTLTIVNDVTGIINAPYTLKADRLLIYLQKEEIAALGLRAQLVLLAE